MTELSDLPFELTKALEGWTLFWAGLELRDVDSGRIDALRDDVAARVRQRLELPKLSAHATVAGLRKLFRAAGCDPTRYRPASEALVRRLLKGDAMPAIHPFVDLNNCLSAELLVPCCVMAAGTFEPPFTWRRGVAGESYDSLRGGTFDLEDKPLLVDAIGAADVPITGSQRVKVAADTRAATLVAYLPEGVVDAAVAGRVLGELVAASDGAVELLWMAAA